MQENADIETFRSSARKIKAPKTRVDDTIIT